MRENLLRKSERNIVAGCAFKYKLAPVGQPTGLLLLPYDARLLIIIISHYRVGLCRRRIAHFISIVSNEGGYRAEVKCVSKARTQQHES